jgi:hypothetical protein
MPSSRSTSVTVGYAGRNLRVGPRSAGALPGPPATGRRDWPNGKTAYVANVGIGLASSVIPISTAANRTGKPIRVGDIPEAIVITKDGKTGVLAAGDHRGVRAGTAG